MEIVNGIAMTLWKSTRRITLELPEELLALVDDCANEVFMSRSEYIRQTLLRIVNENRKVMREHFQKPIETKWLNIDDS